MKGANLVLLFAAYAAAVPLIEPVARDVEAVELWARQCGGNNKRGENSADCRSLRKDWKRAPEAEPTDNAVDGYSLRNKWNSGGKVRRQCGGNNKRDENSADCRSLRKDWKRAPEAEPTDNAVDGYSLRNKWNSGGKVRREAEPTEEGSNAVDGYSLRNKWNSGGKVRREAEPTEEGSNAVDGYSLRNKWNSGN